MAVRFEDIESAFEFVSFDQVGMHQAILDKETGKVYLHSEYDFMDGEKLPEDIDDDEKYVEIPHKNELDLGRELVFAFASEHLPKKDVERVGAIFRKRGAYSRYKDFLEERNLLERWYEYEARTPEKALREWCEDNEIEIHG